MYKLEYTGYFRSILHQIFFVQTKIPQRGAGWEKRICFSKKSMGM